MGVAGAEACGDAVKVSNGGFSGVLGVACSEKSGEFGDGWNEASSRVFGVAGSDVSVSIDGPVEKC